MAKLDKFLDALTEYKAEALLLVEDQNPSFRFLSGTKPVSKSQLTAAQILDLVGDLAGGGAVSEFEQNGHSTFLYEKDGRNFSGVLERDGDAVVAKLWDAAHAAAGSSDDAEEQVRQASGAVAPIGGSGATAETSFSGVNPSSAPAAPAPDPARQPAAKPAAKAGSPSMPSLEMAGALDDVVPDDLPPNYRHRMEELLRLMIERGASDLHLCSDNPPVFRIDGEVATEGEAGNDPEELFRTLFSIMPERNRREFLETKDTDFAYAIEGVSRYRCNIFMDRRGPGAVFRAIPDEIIPADKLGLPEAVKKLAYLNKGLVLVTGPTGSGKSTTLASIVDLVNQARKDHIITIEDPIEFVHPNKGCLVNQREVGVHTRSFKAALRAALREDPDVVLVGELRDLETIAIAIETAETGHLVFGTLHTTTAASTVDRLIDQFPSDQQSQVRVMLSESLRAVVSQTLCRKIGGGRVAAQEILLGMPSISNLIREGKTFQIESQMQTGKKYGMQSLNDHLFRLVQEKQVEPREAYLKAVDKDGLRDAFARANIKLDLEQK